MPANTAMPMAWRISAPAPLASTSGTTPAMKANDVIKIGRSRKRAASSTAASGSAPSLSFARANSTIRIAFLAARPTSTTKPICVKMLLSPPESQTPAIAESSAMGAISSTANGSDQLLYWAARNRKASSTASAKI